jgi:sugar/nucleoside kinase (ribokinase family)
MQAVILGGASWNLMVYLHQLPAGRPQTLFAERSHEAVGSSGAGKALNLRRLGWDVTLWTLLGDDPPGAAIRHRFAEEGIALLSEPDPAGTMRHVNLMDRTGERISIFANPGTPDMEVDPAALVERAVGADLVSVTIFEHCRQLLTPLREAGAELWIDIHDHDGVNPYHADFIEAATFLQLSSIGMERWREFAEQTIARGARVVLCTHGADGASILTSDGWTEVPAVRVDEVVDTNGAGDAFMAGFATALLSGADATGAGRAAVALAAAAIGSAELAP